MGRAENRLRGLFVIEAPNDCFGASHGRSEDGWFVWNSKNVYRRRVKTKYKMFA